MIVRLHVNLNWRIWGLGLVVDCSPGDDPRVSVCVGPVVVDLLWRRAHD